MQNPQTFWDKVAEKYAASPIKNMDAYEATLDHTRKLLRETDKALEIGCGTGTTALKLAPSAAHITASDLSGNMVAIANSKAEAEGIQNVRFVQGVPGEATLEDGAPYDVALAFNLLHLVEDRAEMLRHLSALIKPGGLFISKTVCLGEGISIWPFILPVMQAIGRAPYVKFFKVTEIENEFREAGFEIVEATDYPGGKRPSHFVVARRS